MKQRSIIRVFDQADTSVYENCQCSNVKQRLKNIRDDIDAVKGLNPKQQHARWQKFKSIPKSRIGVEIFRYKKTINWAEAAE